MPEQRESWGEVECTLIINISRSEWSDIHEKKNGKINKGFHPITLIYVGLIISPLEEGWTLNRSGKGLNTWRSFKGKLFFWHYEWCPIVCNFHHVLMKHKMRDTPYQNRKFSKFQFVKKILIYSAKKRKTSGTHKKCWEMDKGWMKGEQEASLE